MRTRSLQPRLKKKQRCVRIGASDTENLQRREGAVRLGRHATVAGSGRFAETARFWEGAPLVDQIRHLAESSGES